VVNNESKRHTVAEPGTGGPPWDAAEETGQIGNEEDSKSEHFWRLTMAPPRVFFYFTHLKLKIETTIYIFIYIF
jgi:hypothetical protein